ncbi:hypothetical protein OOK29_26085 [Streptomyces phaeochromogenes]|uniref:hypothetical protein n=1 Tax=Streptomyces phaeochromogenes TaxID=1923 RepID=UPI0022558A54|nr:hypothetical protein [Streptomyces phaeochromogenes]MCX5601625.1 hypothetical protein [Streptomyces phaeochromogenes]
MTVPVPEVLPHVDAVEAALALSALTIYVGGTPTDSGWKRPDKYAVLYPDPGMALRESLADKRTDFVLTFQVTCVGSSVERVLWVADRVRRALAVPLTVAGRACWRAEELGGPPVDRDDDVTPPAWFLPVQYRLQSTS